MNLPLSDWYDGMKFLKKVYVTAQQQKCGRTREKDHDKKRTDVQTKLASQEDLIGQIEKKNCPNILYLKRAFQMHLEIQTLSFISLEKKDELYMICRSRNRKQFIWNKTRQSHRSEVQDEICEDHFVKVYF